jgi:hypothetical protein
MNGQHSTPFDADHPRIGELAGTFLRLLPVDGAAVAVHAGPDTSLLVHTTDPVIAALDDLQFTLGEGPCVDAYRHSTPVLVPDLTHADALTRWPGFAREATQTGAAATFAFPLHIGAAAFGTVQLYRRTPGPLTVADTVTALLITDDMVSTVLDELTAPHALDALFGRAAIPQATGMIAAQLDITIPQALARLRAAAAAAHTPVLHLARDILHHRITITDDPH